MNKKETIVTHSGGFHADDVFGVATLRLLLGEQNIEVLRTRNPEIITKGDYVLDVGWEYNPDTNRFDHHQEGGAGKRENGIPYASFGLIWKKFGPIVCGSQEVADDLDYRMVQTIDALDNGVDIYTRLIPGTHVYDTSQAMFAFEPVWGENNRSNEEGFWEAVPWAQTLLAREIKYSQGRIEVFHLIKDTYEKSEHKHIVVFDEKQYWDRRLIQEVFQYYPEVMYFLRYHPDGNWQVIAAVDDVHMFKTRKDFPKEWGGKHDGELATVTGVPDAFFCHNKLWMCVAHSKEGALKLAEIALKA